METDGQTKEPTDRRTGTPSNLLNNKSNIYMYFKVTTLLLFLRSQGSGSGNDPLTLLKIRWLREEVFDEMKFPLHHPNFYDFFLRPIAPFTGNFTERLKSKQTFPCLQPRFVLNYLASRSGSRLNSHQSDVCYVRISSRF